MGRSKTGNLPTGVKINRYIVIVAIQRYYKNERKRGATTKHIWCTVSKVWPHSRRSFYEYINTAAMTELHKLGYELAGYSARIRLLMDTFEQANGE
jgi:hypothetical protein